MTTNHPILVGVLLALGVLLAVLCGIGVLIGRDPYQRLQFASPMTSVGIALFVVAVCIGDPSWQARVKAILIGLTLFVMNGVLSHATARAIRIRELDRWPVEPDERIPLAKNRGIAGEADDVNLSGASQ